MTILVTGGAGFIGSNFVLDWCSRNREPVLNLDTLTYAGNVANLEALRGNECHIFVRGDICDANLIQSLLSRYRPRAILHFAAESHVDRSIHGPSSFIQTNIVGTWNLLEASRHYRGSLPGPERERFRFVHVSTDEVYGSLGPDDAPFRETNRYAPNSPYSASKAGSDHLVRSYFHTYALDAVITNCSNNYGPYQFPEKLIPLVISNALAGKPLPVYGDGMQIRDWLYVEDHCSALRMVLEAGVPGETYNIGGGNEQANLRVVEMVCDLLDELWPRKNGRPYRSLIAFVADRPGHDRRYAIDSRRIAGELGWTPTHSFDLGLRKTVNWYLENQEWLASVTSGAYLQWIDRQYGPAVV